MSVYEESRIAFDFAHATASERHDTVNATFGGVDFLIEGSQGQVWLEIKSWAKSALPPHRRGSQRRSYLSKMGSGPTGKRFAQELRGKFLGTCTFLTLTGTPPNTPIFYVMLLESGPADAALRSHMMTRMRSQIPRTGPRARPWLHPVEVAVVDVNAWNARFPEYPATPLP